MNVLDWKEMIEYGVIGVLACMSLVSLWMVIERLLFYHYLHLDTYTNKIELEIDLSKNLTLLATIGTNAPYVGLLGTIFGIMATFLQIGQEQIIHSAAMMSGLALALEATAGGLFVAIPSIVFYNLLIRKSEVLLARWEILQQQASKSEKFE